MSKSKLIYVPQGCFAEITCDTPHEIIGLVTSKMSTCCHITVINDKTGYMALCHADSLIDLENNVTGVPAWIRKACPSQEDYRHLRIHVGEKELDVSRCSAVAGLTYFEQVRNSLDTCLIKLEKECPDFDRSLVSFESTSHDNPYGVVVTRGVNNSMDEHFISGNKITARQNALDICRDNRINNVEIIELRKNDGKEFEEPLISARVYALSKISTALNKRPGGKVISHVFGKITDIPDLPVHLGGPSTSEITVSPSDIKLRPISVFDSSTGEFIDTEIIMQSNAFINPSRVRRNARWNDESSEEGHQYYRSGSEDSDTKISGFTAEPKSSEEYKGYPSYLSWKRLRPVHDELLSSEDDNSSGSKSEPKPSEEYKGHPSYLDWKHSNVAEAKSGPSEVEHLVDSDTSKEDYKASSNLKAKAIQHQLIASSKDSSGKVAYSAPISRSISISNVRK